MQADLAALGYTDAKKHAIKPDGDFGPGTKAALEKFQSEHDLKPDGVAGAKTLEALNKAAHPPQPGQQPDHAQHQRQPPQAPQQPEPQGMQR